MTQFFQYGFLLARRGIGWTESKIKYIYKMMLTKIFYSRVITCFFSYFYYIFFRDRQRSNAIDGSNIASYDLYFDDDNDVDDDDDDADDEYVCDFDDVDEEHVGDFDAFSPERSQYRAFSLDDDGLGGPGDKELYPLPSVDFRCIYSFTRSMSYHS